MARVNTMRSIAPLLRILPRRFRPHKAAIKMQFFDAFGYQLDFEKPITFNEKLNWLKLYNHDPLLTQCSDKYAVRDYVKDTAGEHILNELHGVYETANAIDLSALPDRCVLKVTHGSGFNIIVKDGEFFIGKKRLRSAQHARIRLKKWLRKKQHIRYQEWNYKDITPRVICERYLENASDELIDYKVHCFSGVPHFVQTITGRRSGAKKSFFDLQWNALPFLWCSTPVEAKLARPDCLPAMLDAARALSAPFPYVRVDFYEYNNAPVFGELSFYPFGGYGKFIPDTWDRKFGDLLILPKQIG